MLFRSFLTAPEYLNYSVLTDQERQIVVQYLNDNNLTDVSKIVKGYSHSPDNRKTFLKYMDHTKGYHGLDWATSLPELYQLMNSDH